MSEWQIVLGACSQASGFCVLLFDLHLIRRSEGRAIAFLGAIKEWLNPPPTSEPAYLSLAPAHGSSSTRMELSTPSPVKPKQRSTEERLEEFASEIREVQREALLANEAAERAGASAKQAIENLRGEVTAAKREIETLIARRERAEAAVKDRSDQLQALALLLFVVGLALTTIGSV